ncbi:hypothetical protein M3Y99_00294700 [Aphelenchoides fujianensis]|nr:hypothetical protein M3Y99_00294700 [Aphelenchoides fujianensis]
MATTAVQIFVEEDCSLRRATFLLLALSQVGRPHLLLMAIDFALKSFEIRRDLPLTFGERSVASAGKILRAGGERFVVVVSHRKQHCALVYDHAEQAAFQMKGTCMAGDFLYVLAKSARHCPFRAFRLRLPDGEWEAVESPPFGYEDLGYPLQCLQQGVWSLHCRRKTTFDKETVEEFRSYRIPMTCPESLALRSWFAILGQAGAEVDVPEGGPCSPLAATGLCLNRVFFLQKEKILIRADVDAWDILLDREPSPSDRVLPAVAQQYGWSNTLEYNALQDAIEASFRTLKIEAAAAVASSAVSKEQNPKFDSEQTVEQTPMEAEVDIDFDDYNYGESDSDGTEDEEQHEQQEGQSKKKMEAEPDVASVVTSSTMRIDDYMENADDTADWEFVRHP